MYVGTGLSSSDVTAGVKTGVVNPYGGNVVTFSPGLGSVMSSSDWITSKTYDPTTGILSVTIDLGPAGRCLRPRHAKLLPASHLLQRPLG